MSRINHDSNSLDFNYLVSNAHTEEIQHEEKEEATIPSSGNDSFHRHPDPTNQTNEESLSVCNLLDPYLKTIIEIFTPVLNFISGLTGLNTGSTKEETIKTFDKLILDTESKLLNTPEMSDKAKEAIARVYKSVREMESRKDLNNLDLNELILRWKETKDHKALIQMHEKIKNGECVKISNEKMRRVFLDGLEAFADSLDEALGHPPSEERDKVVEKLQEGADAHVDAIDVVAKRGNDNDLSSNEKLTIERKLNESARTVQEIKKNPEFVRFVQNTIERLCSWCDLVFEIIKEMEKTREEEEKIQKEKQEEKTILRKIRREKRIAASRTKKARLYRFLMNEANKIILYSNLERVELKNKIKEFSYYKDKYNEETISEINHKQKEESLRYHLYLTQLFDEINNEAG